MLEEGAGCFAHPAEHRAWDSSEQGLQGRSVQPRLLASNKEKRNSPFLPGWLCWCLCAECVLVGVE